MHVEDFFGPRPFVFELRAKDRWEAIDELIEHLAATERIQEEHKDAIAQAVKAREMTMSTGVVRGVAIPHALTDLVTEPVGIIGRSTRGIQFHSLNGEELVTVLVLYLMPKDEFQKHVQTLANIAKMLPLILRER